MLGLYLNILKIGNKLCGMLSILWLNKLILPNDMQIFMAYIVFWTKQNKTQNNDKTKKQK